MRLKFKINSFKTLRIFSLNFLKIVLALFLSFSSVPLTNLAYASDDLVYQKYFN